MHLLVDLENLLLAGVQGGAQVLVRDLQVLFLVRFLASRLQASLPTSASVLADTKLETRQV